MKLSWLALQQVLSRPWTEVRFASTLNRRFKLRPVVSIVRKMEEFRFRMLKLNAAKQSGSQFAHYIEALEWVLNGDDPLKDK